MGSMSIDVQIMFVDTSILSNKVGVLAEYGKTGIYLGDNPSSPMTWDGMNNNNDVIPVRISNSVLSSDEEAVAHIAHESFELEQFEDLGIWNQRTFIQQTASPKLSGLQNSWHS
jgi:nitrogen regulatory protein PII-like uncharacterized protein